MSNLLCPQLAFQMLSFICFLVSSATACHNTKAEDMIRHLYVDGNPDEVHLKCPVEKAEFVWSQRSVPFDEQYFYRRKYEPKTESDYFVSGDSLERYALNVGKPVNSLAGVWCCQASVDDDKVPKLSHAVLIVPKIPRVFFRFCEKKLVEEDAEVCMHCTEPKNPNILPGYLEPRVFWSRPAGIGDFDGPTMKFKATPDTYGEHFFCMWAYDNLFGNGTSRVLYSNEIVLTFPFGPVPVEKLSTPVGEPILVNSGDSVKLKCAFKGSPHLNHTQIKWTKVIKDGNITTGEKIPMKEVPIEDSFGDNGAEIKYTTESKQDCATTIFTLTINNFTKNDALYYACHLPKKEDQLERHFKLALKV